MNLQVMKTGTYDQIHGAGSTPIWASPSSILKYPEETYIETESGLRVDLKVIQVCQSKGYLLILFYDLHICFFVAVLATIITM